MLHLVEQQLGQRAHYSHNANSAYGIAFDIVGLRGITNTGWRWLFLFVAVPYRALTYRRNKEFYIVEIDGERPHETDFIASWLKPEATIWVSVANSHAVYFDQQVARGEFATVEEAIAYEFSRLPSHTSMRIFANGDDETIRGLVDRIRVDTEFSSLDDLTEYNVSVDSTSFTLMGKTFTFGYPMPRDIAMQLSLLCKLMNYLKLPIETDMSGFVMPPGRNSYFQGVESTHLIDSTYNAHLISMRSMIDLLDEIDTPKKWLVLGDMVEQGKSEASQHEQLAERILGADVERVLLVGKRLKSYTLPKLSGSSTLKVAAFDNPQQALEYIRSELSGGETILFKGSQYLEWIVEKLLADPSQKSELARQDLAAKRRRRQRGLV